jgi:hypothetical protein
MCFISAERSNLSLKENEQRTAELAELLAQSGLRHKQVLGSWEGTNEITFMVLLPSDGITAGSDYLDLSIRNVALSIIKSLMSDFEQDDVLMVESDKSAWSLKTGDYWGQFQSTTQSLAMFGPGYTYDPKTDTYWVVK